MEFEFEEQKDDEVVENKSEKELVYEKFSGCLVRGLSIEDAVEMMTRLMTKYDLSIITAYSIRQISRMLKGEQKFPYNAVQKIYNFYLEVSNAPFPSKTKSNVETTPLYTEEDVKLVDAKLRNLCDEIANMVTSVKREIKGTLRVTRGNAPTPVQMEVIEQQKEEDVKKKQKEDKKTQYLRDLNKRIDEDPNGFGLELQYRENTDGRASSVLVDRDGNALGALNNEALNYGNYERQGGYSENPEELKNIFNKMNIVQRQYARFVNMTLLADDTASKRADVYTLIEEAREYADASMKDGEIDWEMRKKALKMTLKVFAEIHPQSFYGGYADDPLGEYDRTIDAKYQEFANYHGFLPFLNEEEIALYEEWVNQVHKKDLLGNDVYLWNPVANTIYTNLDRYTVIEPVELRRDLEFDGKEFDEWANLRDWAY